MANHDELTLALLRNAENLTEKFIERKKREYEELQSELEVMKKLSKEV